MIAYKNFLGLTEYDEDEKGFYGHVTNLVRDGITYFGETEDEATRDFERAVDDYLDWSKEDGFKPRLKKKSN